MILSFSYNFNILIPFHFARISKALFGRACHDSRDGMSVMYDHCELPSHRCVALTHRCSGRSKCKECESVVSCDFFHLMASFSRPSLCETLSVVCFGSSGLLWVECFRSVDHHFVRLSVWSVLEVVGCCGLSVLDVWRRLDRMSFSGRSLCEPGSLQASPSCINVFTVAGEQF